MQMNGLMRLGLEMLNFHFCTIILYMWKINRLVLGNGMTGRTIVGELVGLIRNQNSEAKIVVQPDLENVSSAKVLIANGFTYDADCKCFIL